MAKIIISRDGRVLQEVQLSAQRMTLGRNPGNDIVIAHRAVSGEHAAFSPSAGGSMIEDLGSTNGTYVNGQRIARRLLEDGDVIVVAKFQVAFVGKPAAAMSGSIEVTSGVNAGKRLSLVKPVSTLGRPGVQVVAITRDGPGFSIEQMEGELAAQLNGQPLETGRRQLADGDRIGLVGADMVFHLTAN